MPRLFRRLTSCIHRNDNQTKLNHQTILLNSSIELFKLSRFELMFDEILIEIFQYLSIIDLYNGFVNLNYRINILLRNVSLGIHLNQNEKFNEISLKAIEYFHKEILYIHIESNPFINLNSFINLRSLIIYVPTRNQLMSINNKIMPKLIRLCIGFIHSNDENILYENLFGKFSLQKLRFCFLYRMNFNEKNFSFQISSNIRRLSISNIEIKNVFTILSLLPNLYQLSIGINNQNRSILLENNLTKISHQNLRILKIEFFENECELNNLNELLSFVPYVDQCTLLFVNLIKRKDYLLLQKIILENFIQLKQFICSIDYQCFYSSNQMIRKFQKFILQFPFFQTMKIIPCIIHHDKCLRKTFLNKTFNYITS